MSEAEIRKLVWKWAVFTSKKEQISINEEVLSEYIDEFITQNKEDD
jgi:hypothetical protein